MKVRGGEEERGKGEWEGRWEEKRGEEGERKERGAEGKERERQRSSARSLPSGSDI